MGIEERFIGPHREFLSDETPEIELEGTLSSGKTIVALWKELERAKRYPGIWIFLTRWSEDDVHTLTRPEFERVARLHGTEAVWNSREKAYELPEHSRVFAFGLRTTEIDPIRRYGKIRGLPVAAALVDQAEQLPEDFMPELRRRLRPDIEASARGVTFPSQLTLLANVVPRGHWLDRQFPDDNSIPTRRYYGLSLLDNKHNLPVALIRQALLEYPPDHPRFREMILGRRRELVDLKANQKRPYPPDSAGYLFQLAKDDAMRLARD